MLLTETDRYFYHSDHLGSSSFISSNAGTTTQHLQYLPFGESFVEQKISTAYLTPYRFSGKEKDEETGYSYFGARYYNPELSIWLSVDPLAGKYPSMSSYMYCAGNPVMLVEPDGRTTSPIFDKKGNLLGTDDEGMSGNIIIAEDPSKFKQGMKHSEALKLGTIFSNSRTDMTLQAKINTVSKVLEGTELPNKSLLKSSDFSLTLNPDEEDAWGRYYSEKYDFNKNIHHLNLSLGCEWTVENIRLVGGVHEIYGHGIMSWGDRWGGGGSHHKIFEAEMDSKYWKNSTVSYKTNTAVNWWKYYGNEVVRKSGDNTVPPKYAPIFYKYGYNYYKK